MLNYGHFSNQKRLKQSNKDTPLMLLYLFLLAKRLQPVSMLPSKSAHSSNPELKGLSHEGRGGSERPAGRVSRAARCIINDIKQTGRHRAKRKHLEQLRSASLRQRGSWQLREGGYWKNSFCSANPV